MQHKLRLAAILTAATVALTGTALAAGSTIGEMLQAALGSFAPYAQSQEGAVICEGIQVKVLSALTDDLCAKVYLEVTDLTGDRLKDASIRGKLDLKLEGENSWAEGCRIVDYDPETKTALVCVERNSGVFFQGELETTVLLHDLRPGRHVVQGQEDIPLEGLTSHPVPSQVLPIGDPLKAAWELPVTLCPVETVTSPLTGLIDHNTLQELRLSPLGVVLTSTSPDWTQIGGYPLTVFLSDGTSFHPESGIHGHQKDGPNLSRWEFDRPVEVKDITGVALGCWMIPVDKGAAGEGYWLAALPE